MILNLKYSELCEMIWNKTDDCESHIDSLVGGLKRTHILSESNANYVRKTLTKTFIFRFKQKWSSSSRRQDIFKAKFKDFLDKEISINLDNDSFSNQSTSFDDSNSSASKSTPTTIGRPRVSYEEGSSKTQYRRALEIANKYTKEELILALKIKQRLSTSEIVSESEDAPEPLLIHKSLAMFSDLDLSSRKFEKLRSYNQLLFDNKFYPRYGTIAEAKNTCYPEHVDTSDTGATIDIISLLDHTLRRILMMLDKTELQNCNTNLIFSGKYGMDGSSSQQTTKQRFTNDSLVASSSDNEKDNYYRKNFSDESVFITNLVPIEVKTADGKILWLNEKPSSTLYCRPISFEFVKESNIVTMNNYKKISKSLRKVKHYIVEFMDIEFNVTFDFRCTMIDGKVGNVLMHQKSSNCCNICKVGPKHMNDIDYILKLHCYDKFYKFGFPVLHSWIRFMEYVLHISYNLDFKHWAASGSNKELKINRKSSIQEALKKKLGITVDVVKQGYGTTNTGNTARTFFSQYKAVSKIIGIDTEILQRLYIVLQIISCKREVHLDIFKEYCLETANKCVEIYGWYKMPPTVHKVLIHGCDIMSTLPKPIGFYSEEAQEANNKTFRKARLAHSRMMTRFETNEDTMHYLLFMSDPLISSFRIVEKKNNADLISEAKQFLILDEDN